MSLKTLITSPKDGVVLICSDNDSFHFDIDFSIKPMNRNRREVTTKKEF